MLRHCITFLRTRGLSLFLPLDQHIYFHKITGFFIFGYSILHTLMHLLNFSKYSRRRRSSTIIYLHRVPLGLNSLESSRSIRYSYYNKFKKLCSLQVKGQIKSSSFLFLSKGREIKTKRACKCFKMSSRLSKIN